MGCGRTVGIDCRRHISRAGGAIAWASWCRSTVRSTPGSRIAARHARCWLLWMTRRAGLMELRFVTSESAFDYFRATRAYLEAHGKPVAFYSDKHGIFRVNSKEAAGGDGVTQFGRALLALNDRHHLRQQPAGEGAHRACVWHIAGPDGQGAAAGGSLVDGHGERLAARVRHRLQHALWPRPGEH